MTPTSIPLPAAAMWASGAGKTGPTGAGMATAVYSCKPSAVDVDWTFGEAHMRVGHRVTVVEATEALTDPDALLFDPDPKSRSGRGARLLGVLGHRQDGAGGDLGSAGRRWLVGRERLAGERHRPEGPPGREHAMSDTTAEVIAAAAAEADATLDEPMPAGATATRPNRSVPVAVRLTPEDAAAIEALAERAGVPVSALLRTWITAGLAATRPGSVSAALDRLAADLALLRQLMV